MGCKSSKEIIIFFRASMPRTLFFAEIVYFWQEIEKMYPKFFFDIIELYLSCVQWKLIFTPLQTSDEGDRLGVGVCLHGCGRGGCLPHRGIHQLGGWPHPQAEQKWGHNIGQTRSVWTWHHVGPLGNKISKVFFTILLSSMAWKYLLCMTLPVFYLKD